jgi:hypothetical protein
MSRFWPTASRAIRPGWPSRPAQHVRGHRAQRTRDGVATDGCGTSGGRRVHWARLAARKLSRAAHQHGGDGLLGGGGSPMSNGGDGVVLQHEEGW